MSQLLYSIICLFANNTNLALSLLPCRVGAAVPGGAQTVARPPEVRSGRFLGFALPGWAPGVGWTGKGTNRGQRVSQSRPHSGSPQPLTEHSPGLPRLCPNRTTDLAKLGGKAPGSVPHGLFQRLRSLQRLPSPLLERAPPPSPRSQEPPSASSTTVSTPTPKPRAPSCTPRPTGVATAPTWNVCHVVLRFQRGKASPGQSRLAPSPEAERPGESGRSAGSPSTSLAPGVGKNALCRPVPGAGGSGTGFPPNPGPQV